MGIKKKISEKGTLILWLSIVLGGVFFLINDFHSDFWFDEAYSIRMVQHSFGEMWRIAGLDVHPPLYYYMLKVYGFVAGDSVTAYRIFSTLGVVCTMVLGGIMGKRLFGIKTGIVFVLLMILTPINQYVASEIRMYAWTMFFTFGGGLFAYKAYCEEKVRDWVILAIFTAASFYSHYYGAITMIIVYALLFFFVLKNKKRYIKHILLCTLAVTIFYAPWLANLFHQVSEVSESYWILPLQFSDIFFYLTVPFDLKASWPHNPKTMTVTSLIVVSAILMYISTWLNVRKNERAAGLFKIALLFLSIHLLLMLAGVAISLAVRPVFISRYLSCSLPFLLISLAVIIALIDVKKILNKALLVVFISLMSLACLYRFYSTYEVNEFNERMQQSIQMYLKDNMGENDAFLSPERLHFSMGTYSLLYPDKEFYYMTKVYGRFLDNFKFTQIESLQQIDKKHEHLFIINSDAGSDFFFDMNREELEQYYTIEKFVTSTGNSLYKLTLRK